jgi:hypothetical protein
MLTRRFRCSLPDQQGGKIHVSFKHWIPLLLVLFALCYYGSYYRCSLYPSGEGGVEGVTALRLLEGKIPMVEVALNYNLFWFYPIVPLFQIFGPSYTVLRIFFFFLATLTGLLSFYVLSLTTRRLGIAALGALLVILLPGQLFRNYMAFLVMLNMALFLKAFLCSYSSYRKRLLWISAAGLALSLTFLIRIDLGLFLTPLFLALSLVYPWLPLERCKTKGSPLRCLKLSLAACMIGVLGFFVLHIPVYYHALHRGFAPSFVMQYQQWPHMITTQAVQLVKKVLTPAPKLTKAVAQQPPSTHTSSRPQLSSLNQTTNLLRASLSSPDIRQRVTALNLYLPLVAALLLLFMAVAWLIKRETQYRALLLLTSLGCSLTLFPQYFFWRPDMVHLSEFMVPMTVSLLIGIVFALEAWSSSKSVFKLLLVLFLIVGATTLSLYLINGCQSQSTGGIAISEGRTREFVGENGVHVKLKLNEWEETSAVYQTILHHSQPGDYLICFPYNPEINFMTNRRSYRYNLYCDDVTKSNNFDQDSIREIETFHPAVIVVTNWPINGTEYSRFSNWAATTYRYIESHYLLDYHEGIIQVFIRR